MAGDARPSLAEYLFLGVVLGILIVGWVGVVLAQIGNFSLPNLLLILAICSVVGLIYLARWPATVPTSLPKVSFSWEEGVVLLLIGLAVFLYAKPAEYLPLFLDPGWFVSTGVHVAKAGSLSSHSALFSSLDLSAKQLFHRPVKGIFPQFPNLELRGTGGTFLMAFSIVDPAKAELSPWHFPLFSIWIAIFYALGGLRFCLYTAPFFGVLSILSVYFAGKALFGKNVGLLAAILLTLNFTQIYFSRVAYSEILMQFLMFSGIYALTSYVATGKSLYAFAAGLSFGEAFLARIESAILIAPLILFWGYWVITKKRPLKALGFFAVPFALLLAHFIILALTANRLYVDLTIQSLWIRFQALLKGSKCWLTMVALSNSLLAFLVCLALIRPQWKKIALRWLSQKRCRIKALCSFLLIILAAYAYFIRPLSSPIVILGVNTRDTETLSQLGLFLSPLGVWLGILGFIKLMNKDLCPKTLLFFAFALVYSLVFLSMQLVTPTNSYVYSIRRQVPQVIPSFTLLISYVILKWDKGTLLLRIVQVIVIIALLTNFLILDKPYINYRETTGAIAFSDRLAKYFSEEDIVLFEGPWDGISNVGRFAAPLWSIYEKKNVLLFSTMNPDPEILSNVVSGWMKEEKKIYFVSQSNPSPISLEGYDFLLVAEEKWRSSIIAPVVKFPPEIWWFDMPFYIYRIIPSGGK